MNVRRLIALLVGPLLFALVTVFQPGDLEPCAWFVIGTGLWMLTWWVTEVVPIAVASLLPILLFPLSGVMDIKMACAPYADRFVFLFFGGFVIAIAMEKWNLHKRIALGIVNLTGSGANAIILGFMLATAFLSMWISNTATTVMMLPIAISVIKLLNLGESQNKGSKYFALSLMLGIAYAANVGGIGTLVGTPPNAQMAGILKDTFDIEVSFLGWMKAALPFSILMLFLVYVLLTRVIYPNKLGNFEAGKSLVQNERRKLGKWTAPERLVMIVFSMTALLWISRSMLVKFLARCNFENVHLSDTGISIFSAILLFIIPVPNGKRLLEWSDTEKLPWGILLLFGGGLSLAKGFEVTGVIDYIGASFSQLDDLSLIALIAIFALVALYLTEFMSNMALVSIFIPVVAAIAQGMGESPLLFAVPATMAASCAFMFPMSTPPNAIVFSSGYVRIPQMARAGFLLNIVAVLVITMFCYFVLSKTLIGTSL